MIRRLLRRWLQLETPEDGLSETLAITVRCARRCAYDLAHAVDLMPEHGLAGAMRPRFDAKARHWQSLFSSGASVKDYRHQLHLELDNQAQLVERLRAALKEATGSEFLPGEVPF